MAWGDAMDCDAIAELDEVTKEYAAGPLGRRRLRALDRVSFRLEPGEVVALLGPNRAGKTTLLKILLGLCRPSGGRARRFGRPTSDRGTLARVGYLHENQAFPGHLTAAGLLGFYGELSGLSRTAVRARAA